VILSGSSRSNSSRYPQATAAKGRVPIAPGLWLHNLERGAVVLLYNCSAQCSALVEQLQELYAGLRPGGSAGSLKPHMLILPYRDMDRPFAAVAWGYLLELDRLEPDRITQFYVQHVDRGPECRNLGCPE
jgi:hypothetical protein